MTIISGRTAPILPQTVPGARSAATQTFAPAQTLPADKITIDLSSFQVVSETDAAAAEKDPDKKAFKNMRDYIGYMLLMYNKLRGLKAQPGEIHVKMEDRPELTKAWDEISDTKVV